MFSIGSLVVYPAQGVGEIEGIDHKEIGGSACDFYIVRIRANKIKLMVPVHNAAVVGLRELCAAEQAGAILETLRSDVDQPVFTGQNWNRRFRDYTDKIKSPDLAVVAEVLRELLRIGRTKELSFGERRLMEQAMSLVTGELAQVLSVRQDKLRENLLSLYAPLPVEVDGKKSA